ncbi:protein FAR1-RELATED SEQUENCE 5-like [Amborella trichopoda]|uniref:protein FAR1-RELATED SEQUENCE 5-like n=1 Tax=Amborella trichopoda TaxID=13333 RepID=UPI0005D3F23A|nr:protein FAR1-RELATED SEQUENCE 5-like [Amborella trichopoda]|eukprot:XP_011625081.1 protein FAR1-RELATED SEQUENCE 5-like [Amborella trichopoda]
MDLTISTSVASPTLSENDNMGDTVESMEQDPLLATPLPNKFTNLENRDHALSSKGSERKEPRVGMKLSDENDAYEFYKAFALGERFGVRKGSTHTNKDGKRIDREYKCSKEGFRWVKEVQPRKIFHETRCGCDAKMCINTNNEWVVTKFVKDHNHLLVSPYKA